MPYLAGINDTFKEAVTRTFGFQTSQMKAAIQAVRNFQQEPSMFRMIALEQALATWRQAHAPEYNNRLSAIRVAFETELAQARAHLNPLRIPVNFVAAVRSQLNEFSLFTVTDVSQFRANAHVDALQGCLARYRDFVLNDIPRTGPRVMVAVIQAGNPDTSWRPDTLAAMNRAIRYQAARAIHYTPLPNPMAGLPVIGEGPSNVRAIGAAVCAQFAYAGAHVLTTGRVGGPRVEIVSWVQGAGMAHTFILVGRRNAPIPGGGVPAPSIDNWGRDCIIVDPWLCALGHPPAYFMRELNHPFPHFLENLRVDMERPEAPVG